MSDLSKPNNKNEWMVAYITHNISEAHIVAGRLQSEGIPAILDHMAGRDAIGITLGSWGEVRVLVHPENYEESQMILFPDEPPELDDGEDDDDIIYYQ